MLSKESECAGAFEALDDDCDGNFRRGGNKKVDMIIKTDLNVVYGEPFFSGDIMQYLLDLILQICGHPLVTILCAPYDMVV